MPPPSAGGAAAAAADHDPPAKRGKQAAVAVWPQSWPFRRTHQVRAIRVDASLMGCHCLQATHAAQGVHIGATVGVRVLPCPFSLHLADGFRTAAAAAAAAARSSAHGSVTADTGGAGGVRDVHLCQLGIHA
jgi:hypothetical protein